MRKTLQKLGEYLLGVTVNSITNFIFALLSTGLILISLNVDTNWPNIFWIPAVIVFVGVVYIVFLIFSFLLNEVVHGLGKRLIKLSKWYPEWYYRPGFSYSLRMDQQGFLALYITSSPRNKVVHLRLDFHRLKLINARDEQKYQMDVDAGNVRSKVLYDKDIAPNDTRVVTISGKSTDGRDMVSFPFDYFGIALIPGRYAYEFLESGTHKGTNFGGKTKRLEFTFHENGVFEVTK